jgi:predicted transcriptional regulator
MDDAALTSEHVRAARALLRWEQKTLAERSGVSLPTVKRLEAQPGTLSAYMGTVSAIRATLEREGIEFSNGDAPGVRLHKTKTRGGRSKGR